MNLDLVKSQAALFSIQKTNIFSPGLCALQSAFGPCFGLFSTGQPQTRRFLFATSLFVLHETAGITQRTSSPLPLPYEAEADKTHLEIFINFLKPGGAVGVI